MVRIKIKGGEYIQCECGEWYIPVLKSHTTCLKCRRKARYEECHKFAQEVHEGDLMDFGQITDFLKNTALSRGWKLQPNEDILKNRIAAMRKRQAAGHVICPCKAFVDQYTTPDSFCPCSEADEAIRKDGCCHCNVFLAGDEE